MIEDILISLGLTAEEADIYNSLLKHGSQSASQLAKTTKIKRTYTYAVCTNLIKKGLVTKDEKGKASIFSPLSPDNLVAIAREQKQRSEQAERILGGILPSLKTMYLAVETKPVVTYYEGLEGVKRVYMDTLKENGSILALLQISKIDRELLEWLEGEYVKERVKSKIPAKVIVAADAKSKKYLSSDKENLRETKAVDAGQYPFDQEINIYGNKVSIISHSGKSRLLGVIIDSKAISNTFRSWFNLTWKRVS